MKTHRSLIALSVLASLGLAACSDDDAVAGPPDGDQLALDAAARDDGDAAAGDGPGPGGALDVVPEAGAGEGDVNAPTEPEGAPEPGAPDADGEAELTPEAGQEDDGSATPGGDGDAALDVVDADPDAPMIATARANPWYEAGAARAGESAPSEVVRGAARNVVLFVGDGLGISTVTAARILDGQLKGMDGEENVLSFEAFPYVGLAKTYNVDAQTPDSAGTMTAMVSGVKTDVGVIGVDEDVERGECASADGNELVTALELAELGGKATGIVSTARITHATPAATYAKSVDRNWEDDSDMPEEALAAGCTDIASQLVGFEAALEARFPGVDVDGIEVAMGGGRRHFLPKDAAFNSADAASEVEGDRTDGRDLTAEWRQTYPDGAYVVDRAGFDALPADGAGPVLALFNESHMQYEADRENDVAGEPSLAEMTEAAIARLQGDEDGFFLVVESGRIDHAHHAGSAYGALTDTIEFAEAVATAREAVGDDTLIIVTADHGHVFTIAGYPKRGNPILGKVVPVGADEAALAADELPYTTLGYANGRGFRDLGDDATDADVSYALDIEPGRRDLTFVDTTSPGFHQEALVPLTAETHSGEDVGVHATGPGAALVRGTFEQNVIFHVMEHAADLAGAANAAVGAP